MAAVKITKPIDTKCRVSIPREVLRLSGLNVGDVVCFEISKTKAIIIRKYEPEKGNDNGSRE